jgi:hypothetical protein
MSLIARRGFLIGLAGLIAAPVIVRPASLMQIRGVPLVVNPTIIAELFQEFTVRGWDQFGMPKTETIRLTEDEVRAGKWQNYYGHDAEFVSQGRKLAQIGMNEQLFAQSEELTKKLAIEDAGLPSS